jgi:uncharacterized protein DUF3489
MANGNGKTTKKTLGKVFAIDAGNRTAACAVPEVPDGATAFSSETELAAVSAGWPAHRLVEIWNRLPGVTAVSKFTDRKTAIRRIWRAVHGLAPAGGRQPVGAAQGAGRKTAGPTKRPQTQPAGTKTDRIIALLKRPEGATLKAIMSVTGWQSHSVRGFVSAHLTKRKGFKVRSFKRNGERVYRIRS